jgi:hypothetical protein
MQEDDIIIYDTIRYYIMYIVRIRYISSSN